MQAWFVLFQTEESSLRCVENEIFSLRRPSSPFNDDISLFQIQGGLSCFVMYLY